MSGVQDLRDYAITLRISQAGWYWTVTDDEGECIAHDRAGDIAQAALAALRKLEQFVKENEC